MRTDSGMLFHHQRFGSSSIGGLDQLIPTVARRQRTPQMDSSTGQALTLVMATSGVQKTSFLKRA